MTPRGNLFIISAPSGAGKSSLISALLHQEMPQPNQSKVPANTQQSPANNNHSMKVSVSHTSRAPRPGEIDGQHYHFISQDEFQALIAKDAFFEWARVFDHYYGTSRTLIEQQLSQGIDVFLDIDWQGAQQIRKQLPSAISIFILPPTKVALKQRLTSRGQDSQQTINKRMAKAVDEMSHYNEYDFVILNDDFALALSQLTSIIHSQRLTFTSQIRRHGDTIKDLLAK